MDIIPRCQWQKSSCTVSRSPLCNKKHSTVVSSVVSRVARQAFLQQESSCIRHPQQQYGNVDHQSNSYSLEYGQSHCHASKLNVASPWRYFPYRSAMSCFRVVDQILVLVIWTHRRQDSDATRAFRVSVPFSVHSVCKAYLHTPVTWVYGALYKVTAIKERVKVDSTVACRFIDFVQLVNFCRTSESQNSCRGSPTVGKWRLWSRLTVMATYSENASEKYLRRNERWDFGSHGMRLVDESIVPLSVI